MKINILSLATGGGMPFVAYSPRQYKTYNTVQQQQSAASVPQTKESDGSEIDLAKVLSDSSIKELIKNGLPNEVDYFFKTLLKFESGAPFDKGLNRGELYQLANMAAQIINNKKEYDKAQEDMVKKDSMDEWAGEGNYIFVRNNRSKDIKEISLEQYAKHRDQYTPIKNNELLRANAYDEDLAFNSSVTSALKNTIGSSEIVKRITEIVNTMGSSTSESEDYFSLQQAEELEIKRSPNQKEIEGLKQLKDAMDSYGKDALFVLTQKEKTPNIEAALKYIWGTLTDESKSVLKRKSVISGDKNSSPENVVANAIATHATSEQSVKIDAEQATKAKATTDKQRHITPHEQLINGDIGLTTMEIRSSKIPNVSMVVHGTQVGHMTTENGSPVMAGPLDMALYDSGYVSYIDLNNVYFGNAKINPANFQNIIYNGQELLNVDLPVDANGNIAFEQAAQFLKVLAELDNNPNADLEAKNALLRQYGINGTFDAQGQFHGGYGFAKFLVTTGETTEKVIDPSMNIYADALQGETNKSELKRLKQIYAFINQSKKGDAKYELPTNFFSSTTDVVRGPIFMKLSKTAQYDASTNSNVGAMVTNPTYQLMMAQDQAKQVQQGTASLLYGLQNE